MFKKSVLCLSVGALIFSSVAPAMAADNYRYSEARYDPFSNFGQKPEVVGGVYLRVPFTGGLKQKDDWRRDEPRIGFAVSGNLPGLPRYGNRFAASATPRLIDLSMGFSGADSLQFNGINLIDQRIMRAEEGDGKEGEKKEKSKAGRYAVNALAIVGGALLIGGVIFVVALDNELDKLKTN